MHSRTHGKATMKWNRYLSIMALPILSACGVGGEEDGSHPGEVEAIADAYGGEMEDKATRPFDPAGTVADAVPLQTGRPVSFCAMQCLPFSGAGTQRHRSVAGRCFGTRGWIGARLFLQPGDAWVGTGLG